jgi:zinc protease
VIDRSGPPRLEAPRRAALPPVRRAVLANGLRVLAVEDAGAPVVRLTLGGEAGAEHDPAAHAGRATLAAALLDEGTATRTSTEIAEAIETAGGQLSTGAGWETAAVHVAVLATALRGAFELAADVFLAPTFPAEEFERLRRQRLAELMQRRNQPAALAEERVARVLYGEAPYGRPLSGDEASNTALTRDEAARFFSSRLAPERSWLLAAGAVPFAELLERAEELLGSWGAAATATPVDSAPLPRHAVTTDIVDRSASAQTELRMAHAGLPKIHPDRVALSVANAVLGGKFTSRINLNLRERRGLTYGAFSRLADRRGVGPFTVGAAVATERVGEAVRETIAEIERLRQEPVDEQELADTKSYIVGVFPYQLQTGDDLVHKLEELALYRLPDDHFERRLREVEAVTVEDVLRVAQAYLRPDRLAIVAAGPAADLAKQLDGLGEVRVISPGLPSAPRPS